MGHGEASCVFWAGLPASKQSTGQRCNRGFFCADLPPFLVYRQSPHYFLPDSAFNHENLNVFPRSFCSSLVGGSFSGLRKLVSFCFSPGDFSPLGLQEDLQSFDTTTLAVSPGTEMRQKSPNTYF